MADDKSVTINNLYLYVPNLRPNVGTQVMFNEATQKNYKISYNEYYTERRVISDVITQLYIGSSQQVNSPKYLIGAHQTCARADTSDKKNIAIFDNLNLQKYYVEIDGQRYPRDSSLMNFEENDYIDQYKDFKVFFKEYVGEELLSTFIAYPDMKTKYSIEIIYLRHQPDHKLPKKFNYSMNIVLIPKILDFFKY